MEGREEKSEEEEEVEEKPEEEPEEETTEDPKERVKTIKKRALGTARGEGTAYSCLFSTVRQKAGTTYSTVKGRAKSLKQYRRKK